MKDDMETACMNALFGKGENTEMKAQVYVKSDEDNTSIVVARDSTIYFQDVLEVPEITGIQRGVSFVKHDLDADKTEIYPDKLKIEDVLDDAYMRYCRVHPVKGETPNEKAKNLCAQNLAIYSRWRFKQHKGLER